MLKNNEDVLNIIFKISDNLEYEVDKDSIVTILKKQDHKIQKFFRKIKFKIPEYEKISLDKYGELCVFTDRWQENCKRYWRKSGNKVR